MRSARLTGAAHLDQATVTLIAEAILARGRRSVNFLLLRSEAPTIRSCSARSSAKCLRRPSTVRATPVCLVTPVRRPLRLLRMALSTRKKWRQRPRDGGQSGKSPRGA